jgi:hypothetical protein
VSSHGHEKKPRHELLGAPTEVEVADGNIITRRYRTGLWPRPGQSRTAASAQPEHYRSSSVADPQNRGQNGIDFGFDSLGAPELSRPRGRLIIRVRFALTGRHTAASLCTVERATPRFDPMQLA